MATFKVGDPVRRLTGEEVGTVVALSVCDDSVMVQWTLHSAWYGRGMLETAPETATAWVRPEYVGTDSCAVPEGVDPESLAPDGAVLRFDDGANGVHAKAWRTPDMWVRHIRLEGGRRLEWAPNTNDVLARPIAKGDAVDFGWVCLIDWPGIDAWRAQQAQAAPEPVDPPYPTAAQRRELLLGGGVTVTELDDGTLPPQDHRSRVHAWHLDGDRASKATAGPDIIPAAVLARRATGYHRGRVSVPTDTDDHMIPDAETEGIVPRGAR